MANDYTNEPVDGAATVITNENINGTANRVMNGSTNGNANEATHLDALVVGAGFSGCHLLHILRKQGLHVKLVDALDGFGGVWQANWYPGARVDCEMPYYLFSDPDLMKDWTWTERFPGSAELRAYFRHVDNVWQLSKDTIFDTRVTEARYDEEYCLWHVKTHNDQHYTCKWFLPAMGSTNKQQWPDWPGIKDFKGQIYHPAEWPRDGGDILAGKRVAVIGAGASAIQIVQEAAKTASHLTQFVRSPNIALPMNQRKISKQEVEGLRPHLPHMIAQTRKTQTGLPYQNQASRTIDATAEERERVWEENWQQDGFRFLGASYSDIATDETASQLAYEFWLSKTQPRIPDAQKRAILAPDKAPYFFPTKRPSLESDYYEMISLPHVTITNDPIIDLTPTGILTASSNNNNNNNNNNHPFDIIITATGYDAITGSLTSIPITGRQAITLRTHWSHGVHTYLGLASHHFPNLFFPYGPQAPTSFVMAPPLVEQQNEWICSVIARARERGWVAVEATADAEREWRDLVLGVAGCTLYGRTDSWYNGANVPGKVRELLLYAGGMVDYLGRLRGVFEDGEDGGGLKGLKGFECRGRDG